MEALATYRDEVIMNQPQQNNSVTFQPYLKEKSKLILPISLSRYNVDKQVTKAFDMSLDKILQKTSLLLKMGYIDQVDILTTADLQKVNWSSELADKYENHFLNKHAKVLGEQSAVYKWNEWIDLIGRNLYQQTYLDVCEKSSEGTSWYYFMLDTFNKLKSETSLKASLDYQRQEYAAILLMDNYDHIVYPGNITIAWAYLYYIYNKQTPLFTKVINNNLPTLFEVNAPHDFNHSIEMILSNVENTLLSANFPKIGKEKLVYSLQKLIFAYASNPKDL